MAKMTLEGWKTADHAGWKLHSVVMLEDGRARIEFVYRMNHHAAFASFDGLEAVEARNIWDRGRVAKDQRIKRLEAEATPLRIDMGNVVELRAALTETYNAAMWLASDETGREVPKWVYEAIEAAQKLGATK